MDSTAVLTGIVGLILGGGGIGALIPIFRFRADRDSVIATGSEAAVQSLTIALQRSDTRIKNLETENENLKEHVGRLETKLERAQDTIGMLTDRVEALLRQGNKND